MSQRSGDTSSSSRSSSIVSGRQPADSVGVIETRWPLQAGGQVDGYRHESTQVIQGTTTVYSSSKNKIETSHTEVRMFITKYGPMQKKNFFYYDFDHFLEKSLRFEL